MAYTGIGIVVIGYGRRIVIVASILYSLLFISRWLSCSRSGGRAQATVASAAADDDRRAWPRRCQHRRSQRSTSASYTDDVDRSERTTLDYQSEVVPIRRRFRFIRNVLTDLADEELVDTHLLLKRSAPSSFTHSFFYVRMYEQ